MTHTTYEFSAFTEADLLGAGAEGHSVSCGDTFTMSGTATTCFEVTDNDAFLSGDNKCNENANDKYGQQASITGENGQEIGNGGQIYAEKYFWVCDDAGNWYVMLQIEQEGTNEEYFTFFNGYGYETPAEGTNLTVYSSCNVTSNWVDYKCLDAGDKEPDPGWIKGRLTLDADCNDNEWNEDTGQWDEGVEGQTVQLLDLDGNVVAESVTDSYGNYMFDVAPGEYRVKFPVIDGFKFSEQDSGVAEHFDSDADENGLTDVITVSSGQTVANIDAGVKPATGSIEGTVFADEDCDGLQGGEVCILGDNLVMNGDFEDNALNNTGWGLFDSLPGGWYAIQDKIEVQESNYGTGNTEGNAVVELDANNNAIICQQVDVPETCVYQFSIDYAMRGSDAGTNGFAIYIDGELQAEVFPTESGFQNLTFEIELEAGATRIDLKGLGDSDCIGTVIDNVSLQKKTVEVAEPGVEGVIVVLTDVNGGEVLDGNGDRIETVTDADGNYRFDDVVEGDYRVKFENPDGTEFTFQNVGSDDTIDSDVDANGVSDVVSVVADQTTSDVDAGLKPVAPELGSIAGRYFCDENQDGAETDGAGNFEAGVAGATVWLLQSGSGVIASTTTDDDGNYSFGDLEAGNYSVRFEDPDDVSSATEGKNFIAADQGDDTVDSDVVNVGGAGNGNTATFTLGAGENKTDVDGGIEQQFMVCDDPDAVLIDFEGLDGDVGFEAFEAGRVIDDEYAQFGVTITAQRANNNDAANDAMVFDSANPTGGDGDLQTFNQGNLLIVSEDNDSGDPDDAVGGVITFDFANPSRVFDLKVVDTEEGGTVELFDADGNSLGVIDLPNLQDGGLEQVMIDTDGVSQMVVTLNGSGAIDDICIVPGQPGSLSGRYFFDADRDGLDNDVDNGISGIQVELLDENGNGTGVTTTTDAQGNYSFGNLSAGDYGVKFTDPDTGRELTTQNANGNGNDDIDSDAADVGGGMSQINGITVVAGQDTPDNDAGVVELLGSLSGRYFCDDDGDGLDNDGPNGGEGEGVEGITVTLLDANGQPTSMSTTTGPNGSYSFTGLAAGVYGVSFASTPPQKDFTTANVNNNGNDDIDSDAIANDFGSATINGIVVVGGQDTPDNDAGVTQTNEDPEADDVMAAVCADDVATINLIDGVTDPDGDTVSIISISDADETAGVGGSITLAGGGVATLNADGTVTFDPGAAYADLVIRDSAMDQFQFTASDGNGGTDTALADIKICGALNTIDTINESLPDTVTVTYQSDGNGAFRVDIDSSDARLDTDGFTVDVFCVDFDAPFINGAMVETNVYASVDLQPDATPDQIDALPDGIVPNEENLDLVNWILNQDFRNMDNGDGTSTNYTGREIQDAIWFLTNDRDVPSSPFNPAGQANSLEIIDFALNDINMDGVADGGAEGFVAGEDDLVGIILAPALDANAVDIDTGELIPLEDQPLQPFIVGISFQDLEEFCDCVI